MKKDLNIVPEGYEVPARVRKYKGHPTCSVVRVSKSDFEYMEERHFKCRYTLLNRVEGKIATSHRLAATLERGDKTIMLTIAQERRTTKSPDGATWRTVSLLSAFRTADGKYCVIDIAPNVASDKPENTQEDDNG